METDKLTIKNSQAAAKKITPNWTKGKNDE